MMVKALNTEADILIFDLEDAVPYEEKERARLEVAKVLESQAKKSIYVRVNSLSSCLAIEDIRFLLKYPLKGFVVPKVNDSTDVAKVAWLLECYESESAPSAAKLNIIPIVETAIGVLNASAIARAHERLTGIMFGAIDYLLDIGGNHDDEDTSLIFGRSAVVTACRGNGLWPIDTVYANFKDPEGLLKDCRRAKTMGFGGKACIHPAQVSVINPAFSPRPEEVDWAKKVIAAYEEARKHGRGAVTVDGAMVDLPVYKKALQINQAFK